MKPTQIRIWYCKADKKTGKPIIVQNLKTGRVYHRGKVTFKNVNIRMQFNNSQGKSKRSGATTVLEIF